MATTQEQLAEILRDYNGEIEFRLRPQRVLTRKRDAQWALDNGLYIDHEGRPLVHKYYDAPRRAFVGSRYANRVNVQRAVEGLKTPFKAMPMAGRKYVGKSRVIMEGTDLAQGRKYVSMMPLYDPDDCFYMSRGLVLTPEEVTYLVPRYTSRNRQATARRILWRTPAIDNIEQVTLADGSTFFLHKISPQGLRY